MVDTYINVDIIDMKRDILLSCNRYYYLKPADTPEPMSRFYDFRIVSAAKQLIGWKTPKIYDHLRLYLNRRHVYVAPIPKHEERIPETIIEECKMRRYPQDKKS